MRPHSRTLFAFAALLVFAFAAAAHAQQQPWTPGTCAFSGTPTPTPQPTPSPEPTSGIQIIVTGPDGKPLQRKRFYLLTRDVTKDSNFRPRDNVLTRAAYLAKVKAAVGDEARGEKLVAWLKEHDCDTLYCPEYENKYNQAIDADVPGFKEAYEAGKKKYNNNDKLARDWVMVNFPWKNARMELYNSRKQWLADAARKGGAVASVMTDEKGVAYFTNVKLGTYYVSNLLPLEDGNVLWNCVVGVPPPVPRQLHALSYTLTAPR